MKPRILVIESGNLIHKEEVIEWLKKKQEEYVITLLIGAGEQTNEAFKKAGYEIRFCPMGRVVNNPARKKLCRNIAKNNLKFIKHRLKEKGIKARVLILFDFSDKEAIPVNGDIAMFAKYLGYKKIFRLTLPERVDEKYELIKNVARAFSQVAGENGIDMDLGKIEVIGF